MRYLAVAIILAYIGLLPAHAGQAGFVEPKAGTWKTWVIPSGEEFHTPPPPDQAATQKELQEVAKMAADRDQAVLDSIAYWDTGSPSYRWSEVAIAEHLKRGGRMAS